MLTSSVAAGESVAYTLELHGLSPNPQRVSGDFDINCDNYTLCDNSIRFFDIPLQ